MPKLVCPCGYVHDLSPIPDDGWTTIRDQNYEGVISAWELLNEISGGSQVPRDNHPRIKEYDRAMRTTVDSCGRLYQCPECKRVMWQKAGEESYVVLSPEES